MVTFTDWRAANHQPKPTLDDLRNITLDEASQIYATKYARPIRFNELPLGVDYRALDIAVNLGAAGFVVLVQKMFNAVTDGLHFSDVTLQEVLLTPAPQMIHKLSDAWIAVKKTQNWALYGRGWTNRNNDVTAVALAMVPPTPTTTGP
jgi:lysozyme family protein